MKKAFFGLITVAALTSGCMGVEVPAGYVGMVMTPEGMTGQVLQTGRHSCWGRDQMYLVELSEDVKTETMNILCADDLNFKFDLKIRSRLKISDSEGIKRLLVAKGANMRKFEVAGGTARALSFDEMYRTYVQPQARSIARQTVNRYQTTQIREHRATIQGKIQKDLTAALKGTPMEVLMVATSNFDYPDVITKAVEKRREREIQIGEEKAKQAMELLKAENRLKLAQKMKQVRATEADAEAAYNVLIGKSLTASYLRLREIERDLKLYGRVGAGDKVIITNGRGAVPLINTGK